MIEWFSPYARVFGFMVLSTAFLFYVFKLPAKEAIALAFCFTNLFIRIDALTERVIVKSYRVNLALSLPVIFSDLGLIDNPDARTPYRDAAKQGGIDLKQFTFIAIQPALFARSDALQFSPEIKIVQRINVLTLPPLPESTELHGSYLPGNFPQSLEIYFLSE